MCSCSWEADTASDGDLHHVLKEAATMAQDIANEAMMADNVEWAILMHRTAAELRRLRAALGPHEVPP